MLVDAEGLGLRWASASDQTAQTVEGEQERLAQGPCAVAFSQRAAGRHPEHQAGAGLAVSSPRCWSARGSARP